MPNPTPSARSVKEAEEVIQSQTSGESLLCGPDRIEITEELTNAIALALDQRERETWRDAGKVIENHPALSVHWGQAIMSKEDLVAAVLSEAERRGMKIDEKKV